MALIRCPECGKEISNKSPACIHCGYPIDSEANTTDEIEILLHDINNILNEKKSNTQLYKVLFKSFSSQKMYNKNRIKASIIVEAMLSRNCSEADSVNLNRRCVIFDGLTEANALKIQSVLNKYGCITEVSESDKTEVSRANKKIENLDIDNSVIKCPKCKSTAVTTGQRGYSLMFGFIGSDDTVNRCGNCGYKWKPIF